MLSWIVRHPLWVLSIFALSTALLALQARHFEIDASAGTLLTEGNELYLESREVSRRFDPEEFILVAYAPHDGKALSERSFADIKALTAALGEMERVQAVRSIINVPLPSLDPSSFQPGGEPANATVQRQGFAPAQVAKALEGHPIYEDLLVNAGQSATAIQVVFRGDDELRAWLGRELELQLQALRGSLDSDGEDELTELRERIRSRERALNAQRGAEVDRIRELVAKYTDHADFYLGGAHVLGVELVRIVQRDLRVFGAAILGVVSLLLLLLFRSWRWLLTALACCVVSVIASMGLFGALGLRATVISSNFIALQLILTLAIVVHLIVQYRETLREQPDWSQQQLVLATVRRKLAPSFYAGLTTSIGFASLLLSGIQPIISFAWMMIIAMACSISVSLLLFPALLALWPRERLRQPPAWRERVLQGLRHLVHRRGILTVCISLLLVLSCAVGAMRLNLENSFINYFQPSTRIHQELRFIDREFGGSTPLEVIYTIPQDERKADLVVSADAVQMLQRIDAVLGQQKAMGKRMSLVNFTELAMALNDDQPLTEYELTALYRLMDEELRRDLVGGYFHEARGELRINARIIDTTEGLDRGALLDTVRAGIEAQGVASDNFTLTGLLVLYQDLLARLFDAQVLTLGTVYLALFLCFALIFRSLRIALVALAPNIVSTGVIFGVMGWAGLPLDFMTITIAAIAMGIAVDDTIHYIHRYQEERRHSAPVAAIDASHASVGAALLYSTVIIAIGFSMLAFSDFQPSMIFGLLTALVVVTALLADLLLLPVLLRWVDRTAVRDAD